MDSGGLDVGVIFGFTDVLAFEFSIGVVVAIDVRAVEVSVWFRTMAAVVSARDFFFNDGAFTAAGGVHGFGGLW